MNEQQHQNQPVNVVIHGQKYPIMVQDDEEYIRRIANYVDERMAQIQKETSVNTLSSLAILTALNIADELFNTQSEKDRLVNLFEEKAREISDNLSKFLLDD